MPLSVPNKPQRLSSTILSPVAPHGPFCGNRGMQDRQSSRRFPDGCQCAYLLINENNGSIDFFVGYRIPVYNNIRGNHIIVSKNSGELRIFVRQFIQVIQMFILGKTACLNRIFVAEFDNLPFARTQILKLRECIQKEIHIDKFKICAGGLTDNLIAGFYMKPIRNSPGNGNRGFGRRIRIAGNPFCIYCQNIFFQKIFVILSSGFSNKSIHFQEPFLFVLLLLLLQAGGKHSQSYGRQ